MTNLSALFHLETVGLGRPFLCEGQWSDYWREVAAETSVATCHTFPLE